MKIRFLLFTCLLFLLACSSDENSQAFINKTKGSYLFNADEKIDVYFNKNILFIKWRGQEIKPLKVNDSTFYVQPLNEKLIFTKQNNIKLAYKKEHKNKTFIFKRLAQNEKTPSEYLAEGDYEKALEAYKTIQKNDSLNPIIKTRNLNKMGYKFLKRKEINKAIAIFKINTTLHPKSSNTFDNLGDAYLEKKDTINAIKSYKNALINNSENRSAKRMLKKLTKK